MLNHCPVADAGHQRDTLREQPLACLFRQARIETHAFDRRAYEQALALRYKIDVASANRRTGQGFPGRRLQREHLALHGHDRRSRVRRKTFDLRAPCARGEHTGICYVESEWRAYPNQLVIPKFKSHCRLIELQMPAASREGRRQCFSERAVVDFRLLRVPQSGERVWRKARFLRARCLRREQFARGVTEALEALPNVRLPFAV